MPLPLKVKYAFEFEPSMVQYTDHVYFTGLDTEFTDDDNVIILTGQARHRQDDVPYKWVVAAALDPMLSARDTLTMLAEAINCVRDDQPILNDVVVKTI